MDLIAALDQAYDHTHAIVAGVHHDQLNEPTPCTEWDVAALLAHTIGAITNIGTAVKTGAPTDSPDETMLSSDLGAQFRAAADASLAAWREAGLEGETNIGAGPMPRQAAISINLLDTTTHSWDLARATGQGELLPDDLATLVLGFCRDFLTDELRRFAGFAPPVPVAADANPTHQLVAFLGRRP